CGKCGLSARNEDLNKTAVCSSALSLECYSCAAESPDNCRSQLRCHGNDDSCLKLTSNGTIYAGCMRYSDCNFLTLSSKFVLPEFRFSCCQSDLCNGKKKNWFWQFFG
uniref:MAC-inhibitory protein n=1 Tax=Takifugu rubripes TaxID=31033 RepID=A0A674MB86_TAKRU